MFENASVCGGKLTFDSSLITQIEFAKQPILIAVLLRL